MRSKHPASAPSPLPNLQVTNYGCINSSGDDIRVDITKKKRQPAGCSNADSRARGIEDDGWWTRPIGSSNDVEEWRAGDDDNDGGTDAVANAAADATVEAQAAATADVPAGATRDADTNADGQADVDADAEADDEAGADAGAEADAEAGADTATDAEAEAGAGQDAVFFEGEDNTDDLWRVSDDDDVPLLKRKLRHHLRVTRKQTWVVLLDDNSPAEEQRPRLSAADKGKGLFVKVPSKAARRVCQSKKNRKDDGDPGSSNGAKKQKKKASKSKNVVVNEALGSDDDYAEAAGPMPLFPEKAKPKTPPSVMLTPAHLPHAVAGNLRRSPRPVVLQWIAEAWDQVPTQVIIDAFRHSGISSKLDGTENHLVMSHQRARSTTDVIEDMCLGGITGDNTRLLGKAPEEEDEEEEEQQQLQVEGVMEVGVATGLDVLYQETPNYRGAAAEADCIIEPKQKARRAWRVPDLGM
ncbi:unnamed protein product [Closterium sp. NIES-65]|nr:unnamed protein product [Closterium sp. NIES-65]